MTVEYFPKKNWYISKRNVELFEDRVQPCRALGWLPTLYKGVSEEHQVRNFRLPGSA